MIDEIIKELEEQKTKFVKDAEYYDACGSAESSMQAQSELMGFEKAIDIVKKHANDGWHVVADGDLPKRGTDKMFLVSCEDGLVTEMQYREKGWFSYQYQSIQDDVIAWQELPEPYIPKEYKEDTEKDCRICKHLKESYCNGCENYSKFVK